MAARRCSFCSIDYPPDGSKFAKCKRCGSQTNWFSDIDPQPDWEEEVERLLAADLEVPDTVQQWRFDQLKQAGFTDPTAIELSQRRDVDLHSVCEVARKSNPETAYRIFV